MNNKEIEQFSHAALNVIIQEIFNFDIIIPKLVFDYTTDQSIIGGIYMHQNIAGDVITLNMYIIQGLKKSDDIKTVITYGFIHEIIHMYQSASSMYRSDKDFYTYIEDTADLEAIRIVRENIELITRNLNFQFNEVFLRGIERQLVNLTGSISFDNNRYFTKTIVGSLCNILNINFDFLYESLIGKRFLKIIFNNKREYHIDLYYGTVEELNILINLIYLEEYKMIKVNYFNDIVEFRLY